MIKNIFFEVLELKLFNLMFFFQISGFQMFIRFSFILSYFSFSFKIAINCIWLILSSVNAWDTKVSTLFNLLLARTKILSCFSYLFLVLLSNFLIIWVVKEKTKLNLALDITAGAPITVVKEIIDAPPLALDKTIKILSM